MIKLDETAIEMNDFIIGCTHYVIIKMDTKEQKIIYNPIFSTILSKGLDLLWLRSYEDLENFGDYLISNNTSTIFIFIDDEVGRSSQQR